MTSRAVVRLWRGRVAASRAAEYRVYQEEVGPPNYRTVPGIRRIYMLVREISEHYEIAMLTFWKSLQAIRAFAGDPVDKARYYARDFAFLIDPPDKVEHFELLESAGLSRGTAGRERIVLLWRGRTPMARKREAIYVGAEIDTPWYRAVPGNRGVCLLGRELGAEYDEYRRRDLDYLLDLPEKAEHFQVLVREGAAGKRARTDGA